MKQTDEIKRHFDVVAERLRTEITQVAEGVINLGEKFDREIKDFREENSSAHKDTLGACPSNGLCRAASRLRADQGARPKAYPE